MKLRQLAEHIDAKVLRTGDRSSVDIDHFFGSDKMSELLNAVSETSLLVTNLANAMTVRAAALLDAVGICFLNGIDPESEVVDAANEHGTGLIVSRVGMSETCRRLRECLGNDNEGGS